MIVDGGLGLELEKRDFRFATGLWSGEAVIRAPELLVDIHRAYLAAGARVIETATYQLSHAALRELGYADAAIDGIFASAVALARRAIAEHRAATGATGTFLVAAALGPYGATRGDGSEYSARAHLAADALRAFHAERARAVARAGPDVFLFETLPSLREARVIANVARDLQLNPVWVSFACRDGGHTFAGDRITEAAAHLAAFESVAVIGVNCTAPAAIGPLVRAIRTVTGKPLLVCPNLGQHWDENGLAGGATEAEFVRRASEWLRLGVTYVGGCCGVGPDAIAKLAALEVDAARDALAPEVVM